MMKIVLAILILVALAWGGLKFSNFVSGRMTEMKEQDRGGATTAPGKLPGMAAELEESLDSARRGGVESLANWLRLHRHEVNDPRLADIEMDYAVLAGGSNPAEARRVLDGIRARIKPSSRAYKRFQQLDKAYH